MADSVPHPSHGNDPEAIPTAGKLDVWAVIELESETIVRANEACLTLLDLSLDRLPAPLESVIAKTDLGIARRRVFPRVRSGTVWGGALRLGRAPADSAPLSVVVVPHLRAHADAVNATLFLTTAAATMAAVLAPDPLTGLATRSALFDRLDRAAQRSRQTGDVMAALFLDLDGLKHINDRYGHEVGDSTLIETAQRITGCVADDDLVARFGGDEFVVLCESVHEDEAVGLAERILDVLRGADDYQSISASVGIAFSRGGAVDPLELIRRADSAMYRAKARGGSQTAVFDREMQERQRADQRLRSSLLEAISNNGFSVAAQPIFELASGSIIGVELFIRLRDDAPYIANANDLFRLAHEHGEAIDAAILGRAIALARTWHESLGERAPRLHVNVSAQSLASSKFVRRVGSTLERLRLRPNAIAFEIDSRDVTPGGERERKTVTALHQLGVPVVIDGYGGEALALRDIARWQPAMVKIAAGELEHQVLAGLVRGISSLRVPTCVKGIEARAALDMTVAIGGYAGQGNALTPVRQISRINRQLHGPPRLGF